VEDGSKNGEKKNPKKNYLTVTINVDEITGL